MKATNGHEPAYPRPCGAANSEEQNLEQEGMTMREWYAGMAMQGLIYPQWRTGDVNADRVARLAFEVADAMLARAKQGGGG